jgi:hypothetical protein
MALNFPSAPSANATYTFNGKTWTYNGNAWALSTSTLNTGIVSEGSNLYFTNARARASITVSGSGTYDPNTGAITISQSSNYGDSNVALLGYATNANVALKANTADLKTANVAELTNLYFTDARARTAISVTGSGSYDNATGIITITGGVSSVNGQTGATSGFATTANSLSQFASTTSAQLATLISDETGSGSLVFATSPTLVTPILGIPQSGTLTNATGLPLTTGVTGTLPVANGGTGVTGSTGTGSVVLSASPTFTGNILADNLTLSGNLIVSGTTTTINSTTLTVDDKNIELGSTASPSDATADGGGITLKGTTDKTFNYVNATTAWTSSEDLNLLTGKVYEINGATVLSASTLGSGVTASSLTSVGTLSSLAVTNNVSAGAYLTTGSSTAGTFQTTGNVNANNLRVVTASSLGTVQSGTWNGSSISTTYTDAKVTSVNGSTGAVTGLATTAGTLAQFGATTSAQLLGVISDETGTGALVFATSPTLVTPALGTPASGNLTNCTFPTLNQSTTGSAATLTTSRNINGVAFNGSIDITVTAAAGTLTGSSLNATVTGSSLTSVGTITSGTWNGSSISTTYTDAKIVSVSGSAPITASTTTGAVTVGLSTSGVSATTYGGATAIPSFVVDQYGRITSASNVAVAAGVSASRALAFSLVFGS